MITGCAFLTYFSPESALNAQNALHEKHTLPGVSSPRSLPVPFIPFHCWALLFFTLTDSPVLYYRGFTRLFWIISGWILPGSSSRTGGHWDSRWESRTRESVASEASCLDDIHFFCFICLTKTKWTKWDWDQWRSQGGPFLLSLYDVSIFCQKLKMDRYLSEGTSKFWKLLQNTGWYKMHTLYSIFYFRCHVSVSKKISEIF